MTTMIKHFVTFYSPGTFVHETTTKEIDSWSEKKAIEMAVAITERYNAKPFGFRFSTRERGEQDFNSKKTNGSSMYYLGGTVLTLQEVIDRNDPQDKNLISNMKCNGWGRIIENTNSWKIVQPLLDDDVVLDVDFKKEGDIK